MSSPRRARPASHDGQLEIPLAFQMTKHLLLVCAFLSEPQHFFARTSAAAFEEHSLVPFLFEQKGLREQCAPEPSARNRFESFEDPQARFITLPLRGGSPAKSKRLSVSKHSKTAKPYRVFRQALNTTMNKKSEEKPGITDCKETLDSDVLGCTLQFEDSNITLKPLSDEQQASLDRKALERNLWFAAEVPIFTFTFDVFSH